MIIEVWAHLNRRHTQNFTCYRPTKSHYRVEKHTEIPDIIYTQMQHLIGGKVREGEMSYSNWREEMSSGGIVLAGRCPCGEMSGGEMSYTRALTVCCYSPDIVYRIY